MSINFHHKALHAEDIVGWYGVFAIVVAYVLVSFQIIGVESFWYQLLNLTGSLGIISIAYKHKDYQPLLLNLIWAAVALFLLFKVLM